MKETLSRIASLAGLAVVAYTGSRAAVIVGMIAVFGLGASVGAAFALASTPVRTEILPISDGCAAFHQAGRDYYDADRALELAEQDRREAGAAYIDRVAGGTADDVERALKVIDEAQRKLSGAETTKIAAGNALLDADNRCLTELSEVRIG